MTSINNQSILEYLEFVNRLPLTEGQKLEFVKEHILSAKEAEKQTEINSERFRSVVLRELLSGFL
jgi:hypothetical protein